MHGTTRARRLDRVFVDTGGWYALLDADDRHHRAVKAWFESGPPPLLTSTDVFDETVTLARRRLGHEAAVGIGERIRASRLVQQVAVSGDDRKAAWALFKRHADQRFSFTDCTSFALMRRLGLTSVLTTDRHFRAMGFVLVV